MALPLLDAAQHILSPDDRLQNILRFYASLGEPPPPIPDPSPPALLLHTARGALLLVHRLQLLLDAHDQETIGARDLAVTRSLLTLLFQSGINPLLARLLLLWRTNPTHNDPLADLTALSSLLSDLMSTLFPRGVRERPPQTLITTTILDRHVPDLLRASITLAWLPKLLWPQDDLSLHTLRPFVLRLLELCVYMRSMSAHMNLNLVAKSPSIPGHDRPRRCIVEHATAPASCP